MRSSTATATLVVALACLCAVTSARTLKADASPADAAATPFLLTRDDSVVDKRHHTTDPSAATDSAAVASVDVASAAAQTAAFIQALPKGVSVFKVNPVDNDCWEPCTDKDGEPATGG
jgi:hypothetical protein